MFLRIMINHRAGITWLMARSKSGIFSIGKIKPDSKIVGNNKANMEMNMATCWLGLAVDIKIPMERAIKIYSIFSAINSKRLPLTGIPKTKNPSNRIVMAFINDNTK